MLRWRKRQEPPITRAESSAPAAVIVPDEPPAEWVEQWLRERQQREQHEAELRWQAEQRAAVHRKYVERRDSGEPDDDERLEQV
jgi:hypothetical protein